VINFLLEKQILTLKKNIFFPKIFFKEDFSQFWQKVDTKRTHLHMSTWIMETQIFPDAKILSPKGPLKQKSKSFKIL
jgi:hypothetical protein